MSRLYQSTNLLRQLRGSLAIAEKDARIYYVKPPLIIFGILFPVFFFLAFGLGKQLLPHVLVPGLVAMTLFFTSSSVGPLVTPWERTARTYERLLTTPVSVFSLLLGDVLAGIIFGLDRGRCRTAVGARIDRSGLLGPIFGPQVLVKRAPVAGTEILHGYHAQDDPEGRHPDGDLCEEVAGLGPEGTLAAHAAERAGQAASLASLDQDQHDQEQGRHEQQEHQYSRPHASPPFSFT